MTVEWVAALQERMDRVNQGVQSLLERYGPLDDPAETEVIEIFLETLNHVSLWIEALPRDEEFWSFVDPEYALGAISFGSLASALDVIRLLRKEGLTGDDPLEPMIQPIEETLGEMIRIRTETREQLSFTSQGHSGNRGPYPPRVIIGQLGIHGYPWRIHQSPVMYQLLDWPSVHYHRVIHYVLRQLLENLFSPRRERLNLSAKKTPRFFELAFTQPGLHLRPEMWQRLTNLAALELLYQIGGEIEPLTWDEGQGEGVIVRLPWESS